MDGSKLQVAFLVDTELPQSLCKEDYFKTLCITCTRVLLYMSKFPNKAHQGSVRWNYKLFNSDQPDRGARTKTNKQFYDCRSELLDKFFKDIQFSIRDDNEDTRLSGSHKPVKQVYNALAAAVQDLNWDAPVIFSPIRPTTSRRRNPQHHPISKITREHTPSPLQHPKNIIFICSSCPQSTTELAYFCHGSSGPAQGAPSSATGASLEGEVCRGLLPPALASQLASKGIAVHWLHLLGHGDSSSSSGMATGEAAGGDGGGTPGLSLLSRLLAQHARGTVIPASAILSPLLLLPSAQTTITTVPPHTPTPGPATLPCSSSSTHSRSVTPPRSPSTALVQDDVIHVPTDTSPVPMATQPEGGSSGHAAGAVKERRRRRMEVGSTAVSFRDTLSAMLLPPSAHLSHYLTPTPPPPAADREGGGGRLGRGADSLLWFCNAAGKVLFIAELHSMYKCTRGQAPQQRTVNTKRGRFKKTLRVSEFGSKSSEAKSQAGHVSSHDPSHDRGRMSHDQCTSNTKSSHGPNMMTSHDESATLGHEIASASHYQKKSASKVSNHPDDNASNPSSSSSQQQEGRGPPTPSPSSPLPPPPHMLSLGLIKQRDVSFKWLSSMQAYSCVGLYVPLKNRSATIHCEKCGGGCSSSMGGGRLTKSAAKNKSSVLSPEATTLKVDNDARSQKRDDLNASPPVVVHFSQPSPSPLSPALKMTTPPPTTTITATTSLIVSPEEGGGGRLSRSPQIHLYRTPPSHSSPSSIFRFSPREDQSQQIQSPPFNVRHSATTNSQSSSLNSIPPSENPLEITSSLSPKTLEQLGNSSYEGAMKGFENPKQRESSLPPMILELGENCASSSSSNKDLTKVSEKLNDSEKHLNRSKSSLSDPPKSVASETVRLVGGGADTGGCLEGRSVGFPAAASLAGSGRYHSKQYQQLCVWLAEKGFVLLVSVHCAGSHCLGLLQPATSLVASLSLVKPACYPLLRGRVTHPLPILLDHHHYHHTREKQGEDSESSSGAFFRTRAKGVPKPEGGGLTERTARDILHYAVNGGGGGHTHPDGDRGGHTHPDGDRGGHTHPDGDSGGHTHPDDGVVSSYASDPELYASLQLLCHHRQALETRERECGGEPLLLSALAAAPPFTHLPLLPWFLYLPSCGVPSRDIERLQELQRSATAAADTNSSDGGRGRMRKGRGREELVSLLRDYCTAGSRPLPPSPGHAPDHTPLEDSLAREMDTSADVSLSQSEATGVKAGATASNYDVSLLPTAASIAELFELLLNSYDSQVASCAEGVDLQKWAAKIMPHLCNNFSSLTQANEGAGEEEGGEGRGGGGEGGGVWDHLRAKVLLDSAQLSEKYKVLSSGGSDEEEEETGKRRVTEYLLQVFLRFEAIRICCDADFSNGDQLADELIEILRKISLLTNPGFVGHVMKEIVLLNYISTCKPVLLMVYEGLMLPLPPVLAPDSPALPPPPPPPPPSSSLPAVAAIAAEASDCEHSVSSLEPPSCRLLEQAAKGKLVRHTSFQELHSQRQITVPGHKKRRKDKQSDGKSKSTLQLRRSPRIAGISGVTNNSQKGRSVVRSLFSRSLTIDCQPVTIKRKRESDEFSEKQAAKKRKGLQRFKTDILVKETPVKKQVDNYRQFKLQRLRSKSKVDSSPGVMVIQESPRRSFYSVPKLPRAKPVFKTPPLKHQRLLTPSKRSMSKGPSPATLHSLLHGDIISSPAPPSSKEEGEGEEDGGGSSRTSGSRNFANSSDPLSTPSHRQCSVAESPDLFSAKRESVLDTSTASDTADYTYKPDTANRVSFKAARMLTYGIEDPLISYHSKQPIIVDPLISCQPIEDPLIRHSKLTTNIIAITPPKSILKTPVKSLSSPLLLGSCEKGVGGSLAAGADSLLHDTASNMAFALCTPTKEDHCDFHAAMENMM